MNNDKLTFVHIPKNGGLYIKKILRILRLNPYIQSDKILYNRNNYNEYLNTLTQKEKDFLTPSPLSRTQRVHHAFKCKDVKEPIIVIREPYDRFNTMYYFWKNGNQDKNKNVDNFIKLIKDTNFKRERGNFWFVHLKPQSYWLSESDYSKTKVVVYSKTSLFSNFEKSYFNKIEDNKQFLDNYNKRKKRFNVERPTNITRSKQSITLTKIQKEFVNEYFKEDFLLWDKIHKTPEIFKEVIN